MKVQNKVLNKVEECLRYGNRKFKAKARIDQILYSDNLIGSAGWAGHNKKWGWYVKFSTKVVEDNLDFILSEIVPHEVAHIICLWLDLNDKPYGDTGHGQNWKTVAIALGSSGNRIGHDPKVKLYVYKNEDGKKVYLKQREHDLLQKEFKVLRDSNNKRITAQGYIRPYKQKA